MTQRCRLRIAIVSTVVAFLTKTMLLFHSMQKLERHTSSMSHMKSQMGIPTQKIGGFSIFLFHVRSSTSDVLIQRRITMMRTRILMMELATITLCHAKQEKAHLWSSICMTHSETVGTVLPMKSQRLMEQLPRVALLIQLIIQKRTTNLLDQISALTFSALTMIAT